MYEFKGDNKKLINKDENEVIQFEIIDKLVLLAEYSRGWRKELNIVKWRDNIPKFDLRVWSKKHSRMSKGIVLTLEELYKLYLGLDDIFSSVDKFENILSITSDNEIKKEIFKLDKAMVIAKFKENSNCIEDKKIIEKYFYLLDNFEDSLLNNEYESSERRKDALMAEYVNLIVKKGYINYL